MNIAEFLLPEMKKTNLFVVPVLVMALALCFSVALAKSDNAQGANSSGNASSANQGASAGSGAAVSPSASVSASVAPVANQVRAQISVQEHRSAVANFVQALVKVADRDKGIGEQVRVIAQQQNQSEATTTAAMERIQTRNRIKTFLIGTDYKNSGRLRSEMVQTRNRIEQLNRIMEQAKSAEDKATLQTQIQTMEQEQKRIEDLLKTSEGKFSLFGWFVKLFNK